MGTSDHLLCLVPDIRVPQELLWSGGQVEFEGEAENIVHRAQEVQAALDLLFNLRNKRKDCWDRTINTHVVTITIYIAIIVNKQWQWPGPT